MLWVLNVAILATGWADPLNSSKPRNASAGWLDSLRRQLMQDNYDYLPPSSSESIETSSKSSAPTTVSAMRRAQSTQYSSLKYSPPAFATVKEDSDTVDPEATNQDMVYYMDDTAGRMFTGRRQDGDLSRNVSKVQPVAVTKALVVTDPTPNVTLKLIQISGLSRRGGVGPRFVAEGGARGVAIVSVDGAPFPAFRLPPQHRQYAYDPSYDLF